MSFELNGCKNSSTNEILPPKDPIVEDMFGYSLKV